MILFDTDGWHGKELSKFEGGMAHCSSVHGTYKSFSKAKKEVVKSLKKSIADLEERLKEVDAISCAEDLEFTNNPFDNYLRSEHGDMK